MAIPLFGLLCGEQCVAFIHNPRADVPVPLGKLTCHYEFTKDPDAPERFVQAHDRRQLRADAT